jgi:uncharacterized protein YkwD
MAAWRARILHALLGTALLVCLIASPGTAVAKRRVTHHAAARHHSHHKRVRHRRPAPPTATPTTPAPAATVTPPAPAAQPPVGACAGAELTPTPQNLDVVRTATLCLVNKQRAAHGAAPLSDNSALDQAAQHHSADMIAADYFDHASPSGETMLRRITTTGYLARVAGYAIGENIATATGSLATPQAIVADWMNSPGHRANILNPRFRDSGLGILARAPASFASGQAGAIYTQDFGATG